MKRLLILLSIAIGFSGCATKTPPSPVKRGIDVAIDPDVTVPREAIMEWVGRGVTAVSNYLGRFPVNYLLIAVHAGARNPVDNGVTHGNARIDVSLSASATADDLRQDWVMTHEMFHLAFPTLDRRYLWMNEGLSDYLEPVARARVKQITPLECWKEFADNFAQGLPRPGEGGLDGTTVRERIYWGGNIYWLLADVQIREQTHNQHSLDDVIRTILREGGDGAADWPPERVFAVAQSITGTSVLGDLYRQYGPQPGHVDLGALWRKLGVRHRLIGWRLDSDSPDAAIRDSITSRRGKSGEEREKSFSEKE